MPVDKTHNINTGIRALYFKLDEAPLDYAPLNEALITPDRTHSVDTYLVSATITYNKTHNVDALIWKTLDVSHSVNTRLFKLYDVQHNIDTRLLKTESVFNTIDSRILKLNNVSNLLDSYLYKQYTTNHNLDTYLIRQPLPIYTAAIILNPKFNASITLNQYMIIARIEVLQ